MLDVDFRALVEPANAFLDTATYPSATDEQILMLADVFESRAGRPLADAEINALFALQHKLTGARVMIECILRGRLTVSEPRVGEFLYSHA
jgi:hypothetical protein